MLGLISYCLPQKVLAVSDEGTTSFEIYLSKANKGDADAQFNLAFLYQRGVGIPQDTRYAIYWYKKAAEQGHANAQYSLGYMYDYGEDIPQDYNQAFFWYTKAAEKGHYFAKTHRDEMLEKMSQSQIEEVRKLSEEFYEKINNKAK
jgi:TPR repeat protein